MANETATLAAYVAGLKFEDIPPEVREAILSAYRALDSGGDANVAVRSSASAEDTAQFSFAGMFESFLNVRGEAALLRAGRIDGNAEPVITRPRASAATARTSALSLATAAWKAGMAAGPIRSSASRWAFVVGP